MFQNEVPIWKTVVTHPRLFSEASLGVDAVLHKLFNPLSAFAKAVSQGTVERYPVTRKPS